MALTWSVEDVKDWETVTRITLNYDDPNRFLKAGDEVLNPVTEALIFASISTGIGRIKEANAAEVYARIRLIETLYGPLLIRAEVDGVRPSGMDALISKDEVLAHVGLSTNASFTDETRTKFLKRHAAAFLDEQAQGFTRHARQVRTVLASDSVMLLEITEEEA